MAASEEPGQVEGNDPRKNFTNQWSELGHHHHRNQPDVTRMARLFSAELEPRTGETGSDGAEAIAEHPDETASQAWDRLAESESTMAQCLLYGTGVVHDGTSPCDETSISMRPYRLESRMRENRPSGLEGGGADIRSPYPYPNSHEYGLAAPLNGPVLGGPLDLTGPSDGQVLLRCNLWFGRWHCSPAEWEESRCGSLNS